MVVKKDRLPSSEVVKVICKVLELLNATKGKLPKKITAAMSVLSSTVGYGKQLKEKLNSEEIETVLGQLALAESALMAEKLPADLIQTIKSLIKGLILTLQQTGEPYIYPAYKPVHAAPTYRSPYPKQIKESEKSVKLSAESTNLVESVVLREAVEGSEGLEWRIQLIEAGLSKNRKLYTSKVLKQSLSLFEGLSSYADHPTRAELAAGTGRSIRDLAGWVTNVAFVEGNNGTPDAVQGIYHALDSGPIAPLLREAWSRGKLNLVEFSILGDGKQRLTRDHNGLYYHVESIDKLYSLDAVPVGAAGGKVQALIESAQKEAQELELLENITAEELSAIRPDLTGEASPTPSQSSSQTLGGSQSRPLSESAPDSLDALSKTLDSMRQELALASQQVPADSTHGSETSASLGPLAEQLHQMQRELALANRRRMLAEQIDNSTLPFPVKERLKQDFSDRIFGEGELAQAIQREANIWNSILREKPLVLTAVGENQSDRLGDAMLGLFLDEDVNQVPRFHSLHQAYCIVKGIPLDSSRSAIADGLIQEGVGYDSAKGLLMEGGSITWTKVFGTAMERKLIKDYRVPIFDEWRLITSEIGNLKNFKEQKIDRVGYYGLLPQVLKGGTYQPLTSPDEEEATYSPVKRGGLENWTWEDALNDNLGALKKIPKRLALASKVTVFQTTFNFLRDGDATVTTYDGVNLFDAAHSNKGTGGDAALSSAALTDAKIAMRSQSALSSTVTYLAVRPKYLVVPNELEALAIQLKNSIYEVPGTGVATSTQVANPHKDTFEVIVVDHFTDANRWFLVGDPTLVSTIEVGFLGGKVEPELLTLAGNTGSAFTADKIVFKVRHVFGAAVLDHRGLYAADPDW